jgi:hypothetical protein
MPEVATAGVDGQRILRTPAPLGRWAPLPLAPGTPLSAPRPVFEKLDPSIVEVELRRLEQGDSAVA